MTDWLTILERVTVAGVAGHATAITLRYPPKNIIIKKLFSVLNLDIAFFRFVLTKRYR